MTTRAFLSVLFCILGFAAFAGEKIVWMTGEDMRNTFAGKRVSGVYPNSLRFEETYNLSGAIDYKGDGYEDTGNWSITADVFCTFYRKLDGGCFKLHRDGSNCYQAVLVSEAANLAHSPLSKYDWVVQIWRADMPSTCAPVVS